MSSVRQKMAAVQKSVNKAQEALRNGTEPESIEEIDQAPEAVVEEVIEPEAVEESGEDDSSEEE